MRFPPGIAPALLTRMSTPGNAAAIFSTLALSERSAANTSTRTFDLRAISAWAALRSAAVRAMSTTLQPSSAIALAVARPMPLEAPVMRAVLPASLRSMDEVSEGFGRKGARPYDPARAECNHAPVSRFPSHHSRSDGGEGSGVGGRLLTAHPTKQIRNQAPHPARFARGGRERALPQAV